MGKKTDQVPQTLDLERDKIISKGEKYQMVRNVV